MGYKDEAINLYDRLENKYGPEPTQTQVKEYLGRNYFGTQRQNKFIELVLSVTNVSGYVKEDGTEVEGYKKTNVRWTKEEEEYVKTHTIQESIQMLRITHTESAVRTKARRLRK